MKGKTVMAIGLIISFLMTNMVSATSNMENSVATSEKDVYMLLHEKQNVYNLGLWPYGWYHIHGAGIVTNVNGNKCDLVKFWGYAYCDSGPVGFTYAHDIKGMTIVRKWIFLPLSDGKYFLKGHLKKYYPPQSYNQSHSSVVNSSGITPSMQPVLITGVANPAISKLFEAINNQFNSCNDVETTPSTIPNTQLNPSTTPTEEVQSKHTSSQQKILGNEILDSH